MFNRLKEIYKNEQFNPKGIGLFINPFYFARKGLHENVTDLLSNLSGKLLDIGCGTKPYKSFCNVDQYIGLEIDDDGDRNHIFADIFYDGKHIPCEDKEFDCVMANQVFEHVFNPQEFLKEIDRVTKINGKFLISAPFVWDEHEQPYDYARYSSYGLGHILAENGFEIIEQRKSNNGLELVSQLLNAYLYKTILTKNRYINLLIVLVIMAPINILGLVISKIFYKNDDLYLDNIILAQKVKDA